ncbi:MAG: hypothetical protein ACYTEK_12230 [Planctomycetota bacterium]|jgi:hypothetical protein
MVEVEQVKKGITQLEKELASASSDIIRQFPVVAGDEKGYLTR